MMLYGTDKLQFDCNEKIAPRVAYHSFLESHYYQLTKFLALKEQTSIFLF